jgi:hypothetical protein
MASITISSPVGAQTNPTNLYLPFNRGGMFADSSLKQITPEVLCAIGPDNYDNGLLINNTSGEYYFGDYQNYVNGTSINIDSGGNLFMNQSNLIIYLSSPDGLIKIFNDNITSATAGLLSTYLKLSVNGVKYKIALLNDTL